MRREDSVHDCAEPMARAMYGLATGIAPLPARLAGATLLLVILEPREFPRDLRVQFAQLHEALTAEGSLDDTVQRMTPERAEEVAKLLYELAAEVARRDAIEERD